MELVLVVTYMVNAAELVWFAGVTMLWLTTLALCAALCSLVCSTS
jgi:hypothetical protein